jgi:PA domain
MPSVLLTPIAVLLALVCLVYSHPIEQLSSGTVVLKSERSWLWGWAWGAENKVSIVDRSPPLSFASRPAAFGAELKEPLLGYVIPLSSFTVPCTDAVSFAEPPPNLGCPTLCIDGPHEPEPGDTWIALVQRGECEFVSKVREAQRLGANAVVVGGDNPETSGNPDILVNMYSPGTAISVNLCSIFYWLLPR